MVVSSQRFLCCIFFLSWISVQSQDLGDPKSFRELIAVSDPVISPDENFLLYSAHRTDYTANKTITTLNILDFRSGQVSPLAEGASEARWSPDGGLIAMKGDFGDGYGLYISGLTVRNGALGLQPLLVAPIHNSNHFLGHPTMKNYAWSPDGQKLAFVGADDQTCRSLGDANEPVAVDRLMYKSRTGLSDLCKSRIYVVNKDGSGLDAITDARYDSHSLSWSEDGSQIIFLSNHTADPDMNYNNDLYAYDLTTRSTRQLTSTKGTEHNPQANPNSEWLAFPATIRDRNTKDSPPENTFIYLMKKDGTERSNATASLDRRSYDPQWHPGGRWLYFKVRNHGSTVIYRLRRDRDAKPVTKMTGTIGSYCVGEEKIYFTCSQPGEPAEIYSSNLDGSEMTRLTFETADWVTDRNFASFEDFWFNSFDDTRVQGFVAYPPDVKDDEKIPVVHRIHGGPHGMYGFAFSDLNEMLVARRMAVVMINPRGSTGYGQEFADGTIRSWGGGDYRDLMTGINKVLDRYPFLDSTRMVVTGGSYGGFMTNWVITQTNRYKAAVTVASLSNLISFYGTSLYQLLIETEFEGMPWEDYDLLWNHSPLKYVANVKTPTLLIHGENDMDVHITQAEEFYVALKKLGVPAKFIRYPNEGHGIQQPRHKEHYYQEMLQWIVNHLNLEEGNASLRMH